MYILDLYHDGARRNRSGRFSIPVRKGEIPLWTLLPANPSSRELLQLISLACGGAAFITRLPCSLHRWREPAADALRLEALVAPHVPRDYHQDAPSRRGTAIEISGTGEVRAIKFRSCRHLPRGVTVAGPGLARANMPWFFLAYGPVQRAHRDTDRFDFSDPFFRVARFQSLFDRRAKLTDPAAFLNLLWYRGVLKARYPARRTLARLGEALAEILDIDAGPWSSRSCDLRKAWSGLPSWKRRTLVPLLDAARHAVDASPFQPEPLDIPCPILLDRPDRLFPSEAIPHWIALFNHLFPQAQIIATLGAEAYATFPAEARARTLLLPNQYDARRRRRRVKARPGAIALIDVDGTLPNLALMKLSRHFKEQGRTVVLTRREERIAGVEAAFASCIFSNERAAARVAGIRRYYGAGLSVGGSGIDVVSRLPPEIEALPPDFGLYPELGDRAIGFLTRGCPFKCPFCTVPVKEGQPRQVSDLSSLLQGRRKLILLDDNILSHPGAEDLLDEMVRRRIEVNFNQTLDLRLVTREKAELLRRVRCSNVRFTRRVWHFSLSRAENLDQLKSRYDLFGFMSRDNVEFVCMYGYDTTLEQDVVRFRFLRSLPGAYVFVQPYCPVPWTPAPQVPDFFGPNPDRLIRELVSICFPQNMKSMENYYRWLSRRYVLAFGKLNEDLVDFIFRYNQRWRRGLYVATLGGTIARDPIPGME